MLKYEFKEATEERKQEMLAGILCNYNVTNRSEMIQALGHAQAVLDCTQEEFSSHPMVGISSRQLRAHKKDFLDIYTASFEKYSDAPELKNYEGCIEENVMEQVYENLLARLKSPKTATKDIAVILEYFGITKSEFKQFTDLRSMTLRGFMSDNLSQIVTDEQLAILIKAVISESSYLYQGTEKTVGNTYNAMTMDLSNPIVRLEAQTLGLLLISLFNGNVTNAFIEQAQTLRLLKLAGGYKEVRENSYKEFEAMNGRNICLSTISPQLEKDLLEWFGVEEGKEMLVQLNKVSEKADINTSIQLPKYEQIADDYAVHLQVYPELEQMSLKVLLAKLDAKQEKLKDKYQQYIKEITEE